MPGSGSITRSGAALFLAGAVLVLAGASHQGEAQVAADAIRVRIDRAVLRTPSWAFWTGVLRVRGSLVPADGSPPSRLSLPARDLRLSLGNPGQPVTWRIPALDPGWRLQGKSWTWRPATYGYPMMRLRYDLETGAFDLVVPDSQVNGVGVFPFGQQGPVIVMEVAVGDSLQGRCYTVLSKRGSRLYSHWPADLEIGTLETGGPPIANVVSDKEWYGGRLLQFEVPTAGRYLVRTALGTLTGAMVTVWSVPDGARWGGTVPIQSGEPDLLLDLIPGTYFVQVEPLGYSGTFAVSIAAPTDPEVLLVNAAAVQGSVRSEIGWCRLFTFDVEEAGDYTIEALGIPGIWSYPFTSDLRVFGPGEGMNLLSETTGTDARLTLHLEAGRHLIAISPAESWNSGSFTVGVTR